MRYIIFLNFRNKGQIENDKESAVKKEENDFYGQPLSQGQREE